MPPGAQQPSSIANALRRLPRVQLAHLPTPVHPLPRLGARLGGVELWVKRDDLTGLGMGGNKVRKLELLLAEAQAHGARTIVTVGAVQSNHCRQTAAAAARLGLECVLVLGGERPASRQGNVLLDHIFGAELIWAGPQDRDTVLAATFDRLWADGRRPYRIPFGGSNPLGAAAYALGLLELLEQKPGLDRIVFASSSGGTQAGLVVGAAAAGFKGEILGISVDLPASELRSKIARLAAEVGDMIGQRVSVAPESVEVVDEYCRSGYAVVGDLEREGIREFARTEGLVLDPVYTGRAGGGLIDLIRSRRIRRSDRTLFWHTGGEPALFAYSDQVV